MSLWSWLKLDGTSQMRSPGGKIIHSYSPPPRPG